MEYLVDTNMLLRAADLRHPLNATINAIVERLKQDEHILYITSQNCIEFWNVLTRPAAKNGFGLTLTEAQRLLRFTERTFSRLPDTDNVYPEWRRLVLEFAVSGVQVHDARLVAFMLTNNITHILTFNTKDFTRYTSEGIVAVDPSSLST